MAIRKPVNGYRDSYLTGMTPKERLFANLGILVDEGARRPDVNQFMRRTPLFELRARSLAYVDQPYGTEPPRLVNYKRPPGVTPVDSMWRHLVDWDCTRLEIELPDIADEAATVESTIDLVDSIDREIEAHLSRIAFDSQPALQDGEDPKPLNEAARLRGSIDSGHEEDLKAKLPPSEVKDTRRKATVNARMFEVMTKLPESQGSSTGQWSTHLSCSKSTVAVTQADKGEMPECHVTLRQMAASVSRSSALLSERKTLVSYRRLM